MAHGLMEVKLSSGRKVLIKSMSIDDIDECKDAMQIVFGFNQQAQSITGLNKARTLWIRKGLGGGDFVSKWNKSKPVPDDVIKELTDAENVELVEKIQEKQKLGKSPS